MKLPSNRHTCTVAYAHPDIEVDIIMKKLSPDKGLLHKLEDLEFKSKDKEERGEIAQQAKALAATPDNLKSIL